MGQRYHHQNKRQKPRASAPTPVLNRPAPPEKKVPLVYGKPFVVLEDDHKRTFVYVRGGWVSHTRTIAQCREDSQVKELPQKINGMTRYEICAQVTSAV
jgi:hypothetical protein